MNDRVLLVIPCFHESGRIAPFLQSLCEVLVDDPAVTVQVVDDGSGDTETTRLRAIVDEQRMGWPGLRQLLCIEHVGKGGAIYEGWDTNEGESWLAFVDADGSCPATEVKRLLALRCEGALFASRIKMLGRSIKRHWHRHLLGRIFATLVSELLDIPVYDSQCGLKLVPRAMFDQLRPRLYLRGFSFDVELLTELLDAGCRIIEVPIDWREIPGGKVRILRDSLRMARDVLRVRKRRMVTK